MIKSGIESIENKIMKNSLEEFINFINYYLLPGLEFFCVALAVYSRASLCLHHANVEQLSGRGIGQSVGHYKVSLTILSSHRTENFVILFSNDSAN